MHRTHRTAGSLPSTSPWHIFCDDRRRCSSRDRRRIGMPPDAVFPRSNWFRWFLHWTDCVELNCWLPLKLWRLCHWTAVRGTRTDLQVKQMHLTFTGIFLEMLPAARATNKLRTTNVVRAGAILARSSNKTAEWIPLKRNETHIVPLRIFTVVEHQCLSMSLFPCL